jgi:hypothetical protein
MRVVFHTFPGFWANGTNHNLILLLVHVDVDDVPKRMDPFESRSVLEGVGDQGSDVEDVHASPHTRIICRENDSREGYSCLPTRGADVTTFLLVFGAAFASALFRTFNQLHVMRLRYATVIPCNIAISFVDFCVIASVVKDGLWVFLPAGLGQGVGSLVAMKLFERYRKPGNPENLDQKPAAD